MRPSVLLKSQVIQSAIITALAAESITMSEAADRSGLHRNAFALSVAKMIRAGLAPESLLRLKTIGAFYDGISGVSTPDMHSADRQSAEIDRLRKKLTDANNRAREAEARLSADTALADIIAGIKFSKPNPPEWIVPDNIPALRESESVPILVLTDWHLGEVVAPDEAGGYTYNAAIARSRVRETVERTISLTKESLRGLRYPGIICALGGDLVSGALHQELAETDEYSRMKSVIVARDLAIGAINTLVAEFGRVFVPCAVGNHGRAFDRRPRAKRYAENNLDWIIYELIADHFKNDDRVSVMNHDSGESLFSVYGRKFLLTHGDMLGTKGGDGIIGAIGPIMRGSLKTLKSMNSLGHDVDHLIIGHWHQQISLPNVTVCGTLKGPDEYAMKHLRVPAEDPSQTLLVVHPEHGITFRQPIFLKDKHCPDRKKEAKNAAWVSVFSAS